MQKNINAEAQKRRKKDAVKSAISATISFMLSSTVLLLLRWYYQIEDFWGTILLAASVAELGMIIPVWILLKIRLNEIEGGEEDVAAQY